MGVEPRDTEGWLLVSNNKVLAELLSNILIMRQHVQKSPCLKPWIFLPLKGLWRWWCLVTKSCPTLATPWTVAWQAPLV